MEEHNKRKQNIFRFAFPPEGTDEFKKAIDRYENHYKNNSEFQKQTKESLNKALAIAKTQLINGANLPIDKELRHFVREFNSRNWEHGLLSMPSSFNILESFFSYDPAIQLFQLLEEEDHIFNLYDFIDFITSPDFKEEPTLIEQTLEKDLIYNYNILNDVNEISFTSENGEEFVIGGISIIRRENEATVFLLTGKVSDVAKETAKLQISSMKSPSGKEGLKPAEGLNLEAVKLFDKHNLWKVLAYCRIDLNKQTIDTRYVQPDIGVGYQTITDDLTTFISPKGEFILPELEDIYKKSREEINFYSPLFDFATKCLYLPHYFNQFEEQITEEEHETELGSEKERKAIFRKDKIVPSSLKIKNKTVWVLNRNIVTRPDIIYFGDNEFNIEKDGYWKRLQYNTLGKDKNGNPIHGRTWVDITQTWFEKSPKSLQVNLQNSTYKTTSSNEGFIYIMRNASHDLDIYKIGLTTRDSKTRAKELSSTTGSPDKFLVANEWKVADCSVAEKIIHNKLDKFRINRSREFFRIEYNEALKIIQEVVNQINNI